MKSIIIIDDHNLFASSLSMMISHISEFNTLQIFNNGLDFVNFAKDNDLKLDAEIILLDINMPIMDGVETMNWINKNMPDQKVIALSFNEEEKVVLKMAKLGVKGYLLKDCEPSHFKEALETVSKNGYFYSDKISKYIFDSINKPQKDLFNEKESLFIKLACSEMTYKEIAEIMHVSPKTIENYRESVFDKLNVKSRIGIVLFAAKNAII